MQFILTKMQIDQWQTVGMPVYYSKVQSWAHKGSSTTMEITMTLSYKKLWHQLIDKEMTKMELQKAAGLSWGTVAKLNRGENVNTSILMRICTVLDCDISEIMEIVRDNKNEQKTGRSFENSQRGYRDT